MEEFPSVVGELSGIDDADVCLAVGEQEAAAQPFVQAPAPDQTAAGEPALAEVGGTTGANVPQRGGGGPPRLGSCRGQGQKSVDAVVEGHHGNPVARPESINDRQRGLAGARPLVTAHGARAVED